MYVVTNRLPGFQYGNHLRPIARVVQFHRIFFPDWVAKAVGNKLGLAGVVPLRQPRLTSLQQHPGMLSDAVGRKASLGVQREKRADARDQLLVVAIEFSTHDSFSCARSASALALRSTLHFG